jgi:hypothetical protein
MEMIPWIWFGMITYSPISTFGKWSGMAIHTSFTISPTSLDRAGLLAEHARSTEGLQMGSRKLNGFETSENRVNINYLD